MAKIKIVCEGDSIMEGYPLAAGQSMPYQLNALLQARNDGNTYTVVNQGFRNRTMAQMLSRYAANVAPQFDPTADQNIFLLWGGGNDIYFAANQQQNTINNYNSLVNAALATGFDVWVMNIIQRGMNASGTIQTWRNEAAAINAAYAARQDATLLDVRGLSASYRWEDDPWTNTSLSTGARPEYYDWAHPNGTAHAAVAAWIEPMIDVGYDKLVNLGGRSIALRAGATGPHLLGSRMDLVDAGHASAGSLRMMRGGEEQRLRVVA